MLTRVCLTLATVYPDDDEEQLSDWEELESDYFGIDFDDLYLSMNDN